jgi:hypothetical protein
MDSAKSNHIRFRLRRLKTQAERIADEIGEFLDFLDLIIVREDDRVPLAFERKNVRNEIDAKSRHVTNVPSAGALITRILASCSERVGRHELRVAQLGSRDSHEVSA